MQKFEHKKSLGQNFLNNLEIVERIVDEADLKKDDVVIEVGAGEGVLTEALAKKAGKVLAVELDDRLIPFLKEKFSKVKKVEIVHANILKININEFLEQYDLHEKSFKVVANIPYYITSPIIRLFLELPKQPAEIFLMVQKEVAERVVAEVGKMSILAVASQFYADVEYLFTVQKKYFNPVPKVDSAIIKLVPKRVKNEADRSFFKVIKIGFSAKRKTLCNNLANGFHKNKKDVEEILLSLGFKSTVRAQELSIDDWREVERVFGKF